MHHQQHNQFLNNINYLNINKQSNIENVPLIERSISAKQRTDYSTRFDCPSVNSFHLGSDKSNKGSLTDTYRLNFQNTKAKDSRAILDKNGILNGNLVPFKFNNISYQSLRPQSMTTAKHFMEYSFKNPNMLQINPNSKNTADPGQNGTTKTRDSDTLSNSNYNPNQQTSHSFNPKIIQDSNKFIENILAHSKRNLKPPPSLRVNNSDSRNQLQLLSASLNLPANVITINRSSEERFLFPDKLILERRNLNICPNIEGDLQLKLINYQHNQIRSIQNLDQMSNLIFLDLYDNRIERIAGLSNLVNLRVLMLGKNRISKIENLENLTHLDVLDLHGNQIPCIENLKNLHELRVLNIAANLLKKVDNLSGLHSLVELNLRRNQIAEINDLEHCTKLQRLFLSFNEIVSIMRIKHLNKIINLQELTLDNNPLSTEKNYKRNILAQLVSLRKLDSKKVTDEEKRNAERMFCKSEMKKRELENYYSLEEKRKLAIRDAKSDWLNQHQNKQDFVRLSLQSENLSSENYHQLREATSDLLITNSHHNMDVNGNSSNTGPLCSSNLRQIHIKGNGNSNIPGVTNAFNYSSYLQQYQHQLVSDPNLIGNNNHNKKINAKLKIVQMRNRNESLGSLNQNSFSNPNVNLISTNNSSTNSLHSQPENDNFKQAPLITGANNDASLNLNDSVVTDLDPRPIDTFAQIHKQATTILSRNSSAKVGALGTILRNPNNLLSSIATTSSSSVSGNRRSTAFNNGSNVHEDNTMFFYGSKSMEILDSKLDPNVVQQITVISFNYIDYDDNLSKNFNRIKNKFPNTMNLVFTCCNIKSLNQIDSICDWRKLDSLTVNKEDNPIFMISIWTHYALFRLNNLQLKKLNDKLVTPEDVLLANKYLNQYSNLALYLPEFKLLTILGQERKKLIKLAKENLYDPAEKPTIEQLNAREQLVRLVLSSNFTSKLNSSAMLNADTDFFLADKKMNQSQSLVNSVVSQMHYNDMKTQKIKHKKAQIWQSLISTSCRKEPNQNDKHIASLLKHHKFRIL